MRRPCPLISHFPGSKWQFISRYTTEKKSVFRYRMISYVVLRQAHLLQKPFNSKFNTITATATVIHVIMTFKEEQKAFRPERKIVCVWRRGVGGRKENMIKMIMERQ
jgi:hypothetical protein